MKIGNDCLICSNWTSPPPPQVGDEHSVGRRLCTGQILDFINLLAVGWTYSIIAGRNNRLLIRLRYSLSIAGESRSGPCAGPCCYCFLRQSRPRETHLVRGDVLSYFRHHVDRYRSLRDEPFTHHSKESVSQNVSQPHSLFTFLTPPPRHQDLVRLDGRVVHAGSSSVVVRVGGG